MERGGWREEVPPTTSVCQGRAVGRPLLSPSHSDGGEGQAVLRSWALSTISTATAKKSSIAGLQRASQIWWHFGFLLRYSPNRQLAPESPTQALFIGERWRMEGMQGDLLIKVIWRKLADVPVIVENKNPLRLPPAGHQLLSTQQLTLSSTFSSSSLPFQVPRGSGWPLLFHRTVRMGSGVVRLRAGKEFPDTRQSDREIKFVRVGDTAKTLGWLKGEPTVEQGVLGPFLYPGCKERDRGLACHLLTGWGKSSGWRKSKANTVSLPG